MSEPIDYSKFDNIGNSSDSEDDLGAGEKSLNRPIEIQNQNQNQLSSSTSQSSQSQMPPTSSMKIPSSASKTKRDPSNGRYIFEYNNHKIYEWEQTLEEVEMYIETPTDPNSSFKASDFEIRISAQRLQVGMRGRDRLFLDESTFGKVDTKESSWYLDKDDSDHDGKTIIHIILIKAYRGQVWDSALVGKAGGSVDPLTQEAIRKDMMRERFQEENPGFDFRNAEFNGEAPDPREFMGGVKYR